MTLTEFVSKWAKDDRSTESKLKAMLSGFFNRDPRTIRNWMSNTPDYVRWVLGKVDAEWQQTGRVNYQTFFVD